MWESYELTDLIKIWFANITAVLLFLSKNHQDIPEVIIIICIK